MDEDSSNGVGFTHQPRKWCVADLFHGARGPMFVVTAIVLGGALDRSLEVAIAHIKPSASTNERLALWWMFFVIFGFILYIVDQASSKATDSTATNQLQKLQQAKPHGYVAR